MVQDVQTSAYDRPLPSRAPRERRGTPAAAAAAAATVSQRLESLLSPSSVLSVWYLNSGQHTDLYACSPGCIKRLTLLQADSTNETSEHAIDLLDKLLVLDPNSRVSAEKMLEHEYFWTGAYAAASLLTRAHVHIPRHSHKKPYTSPCHQTGVTHIGVTLWLPLA